jgi:hypothetical protein
MKEYKMRISIFIMLLLTQLSCFATTSGVDYKRLTSLIKDHQIGELRKELSHLNKSQINSTGRSVLLMYSIEQRRPKATAALLDWGVDVNRSMPTSADGEAISISPLNYAISIRADVPVIELLVERGADVNQRSEIISPLNYSISMKEYRVADYLLEHGAKPEGYDGIFVTPLMELALSGGAGSREIDALSRKLISKGAKVNSKNSRGLSSLSIAIKAGNASLVQTLLELGADPNTINGEGESMQDLARKKQFPDISALLTKYGAKP